MITLQKVIAPYIEQIEQHLNTVIAEFGTSDQLACAIGYSLQQKGKRLRPAITLMVAEALGTRTVLDSAIALELFHTASLLADDLPCMDNSDDRRGHLSTHKAFNEATALLASYSLIAKGYQLIAKNGAGSAHHILPLALQNASQNTGYWGASGGQFLDLYPRNVDGRLLDEVMTKKTAALFETAFLFGWLFGGGEGRLKEVKQVGMNFGFAFQLVDDLLDYEEDFAAQRKINYAIFYGKERTKERVKSLLEQAEKELHSLQLATPPLLALIELLSSKIR